MELFHKIQNAIYLLETIGSKREDLKITTSFVVKRIIENQLHQINTLVNLNSCGSKIFGIDVCFDHFDNDIVVYDKTKACLRKDYKILIKSNITSN